MNDTAIKVDNLSKRYRIGQREPYKTFRDAITSSVSLPGHFFKGKKSTKGKNSSDTFWALKDVSFEVETGEIVGIIGRNGAGKSTLLKVLSRITLPTEGSVELHGRISSLLEVGTGFHPELTGRENIYLSGSILGMKRREIEDKFDEIVKFSEIEKFLDTPAKRYSSGMYVRLAFAVAAHLESEILLLDEVLAVGDIGFQKKCLGKMKDASGEGRTVLFVSHNMNAIAQLCESCMMLENGQLKKYDDTAKETIKAYLFGSEDDNHASEWVNIDDRLNNPWFKPLHFYLGDEKGNLASTPSSNDSDMWIYIKGEINDIDPALNIGYAIYSEDGALLYWSFQTDENDNEWIKLSKGINIIRTKLPGRFLNEGVYSIECIGNLHYRQWLFEPGNNAPSIFLTINGGLSDSPYWMVKRPGLLAPNMKFEVVGN
jgi:lipopolysaccharide transport system ATP-binding protein